MSKLEAITGSLPTPPEPDPEVAGSGEHWVCYRGKDRGEYQIYFDWKIIRIHEGDWRSAQQEMDGVDFLGTRGVYSVTFHRSMLTTESDVIKNVVKAIMSYHPNTDPGR